MACRTVQMGDATMIVCSRGQKVKPCDVPGCRKSSVALCDAPVQSKFRKTCDRPMCDDHRYKVSNKVDWCIFHAADRPSLL